jgi:chaperonin cofactor prefoldin
MTEPNAHSPTDNQNEKIIDSLRNDIASLKSQMKKKDERIASLDAMINTLMESHSAEVRAYEELKDKLEDVIEMLRKRIPHGDILRFLKAEDSNDNLFQKLW